MNSLNTNSLSGLSHPYQLGESIFNMSRVMRKPTFCICENKDADQLRGNREADQRLCFRYIDSTIPLISGDGQDKPMCFRPNPVHRLMYDNCMYHMMNKIKV